MSPLFRIRSLRWLPLQAVVALSLAACGGGSTGTSHSGSPTSPSGPAGGGPPTVTTNIVIGADGVAPASIQVSVGQRVTITNSGASTVQMSSDPHPTHTDCPQINALGTLAPGQAAQTAIFTAARTCGFHDHNDPENASLRGTIVIVP